jgi:hypothetical protein
MLSLGMVLEMVMRKLAENKTLLHLLDSALSAFVDLACVDVIV